MVPADSADKWLCPKEAAEEAGVSVWWLAMARRPDWAGTPGPPFYRTTARKIEYLRSEIRAWRRSRRVAA